MTGHDLDPAQAVRPLVSGRDRLPRLRQLRAAIHWVETQRHHTEPTA